MSTGTRPASFACAPEDEDAVRLLLLRWAFVEPGSIRYRNGAVHYDIDLARVGHGDGPAAELMVRRELERAVALHRVSTEPPPAEAVPDTMRSRT